MPRRIKLVIEYDGTDFKGWQVQSGERAGEPRDSDVRTVQGEIERALRSICGQPVRIAGCSRTDAGVHAMGQVASLLLPDDVVIDCDGLVMALNSRMDKDVAARSAEEVPEQFHAQRDAVGKIYSYSMISRRQRPALLRRTHWHVKFDLQIEPMRAAAARLIGRHDFTSFVTKLAETQATRAEEGKTALEVMREVRRLELHPDPDFPGRIVMYIEGSGFLYQQVRTIAGSLVDVGRGFRAPEWISEVLAAKDRRKAGPTAPPHGLCLERILY
jgi:tRNA pseudouridine38-40 synthase